MNYDYYKDIDRNSEGQDTFSDTDSETLDTHMHMQKGGYADESLPQFNKSDIIDSGNPGQSGKDQSNSILIEQIKAEILADLKNELYKAMLFESPEDNRLSSEQDIGDTVKSSIVDQHRRITDHNESQESGSTYKKSISDGLPGQGKLVYDIGATALAFLLFPSLRDNLHDKAVRTIEDVINLSDHISDMITGTKKDIENIIAEATFNNIQRKMMEELSLHGSKQTKS